MNFKRFVRNNWELILLISVSLILRLWHFDNLSTFGGDQGIDFQNIKSIAEGNLTLLGPKIGPYNNISTPYLGPLYYYLLLPFLFFSKFDPVGAGFAVVIARLTTTILIYLATKNFFNKKVAFYAALISAISPYWVDHLGPPSSPYFILPLASAILFLISKENLSNHKSFVTIGFLAGLAIHLHYLALVLIPSALSYLLIKKDKFFPRGIALFFLGLFVAISPIFLFEVRHNFFLTDQILKQLTIGILTTGTGNLYSNVKNLADFISYYLFGLDKIGLVFLSIILLLSAHFLIRAPRKDKLNGIFLLLFISINLIGASVYFGKPQPHYLASAFVPLFIIVGYLLFEVEKINKFIFSILIILIAVGLLRNNHLFANQDYTMPEDLTLNQIRKMSQIIANDVDRNSFNIVSTLDGDSRANPYRYLVKVYGKNPAGVENYDRVDNLYVITRDPARSIRDNNLFEIASFQPSNVIKDWSIIGDIHLIKLTKKETSQESIQKFVTIVNPVRSRKLWNDNSIGYLEEQVQSIKKRDLKATWLLQYDNLFDEDITNLFKSKDTQEIGAFLEVSEKWATDSYVSYKFADGDYFRPDKVFLSGYMPEDRKKLIKTYFKNFYKVFSKYPKSVGAWYIDAVSQNLLSKLGVTSALTVADQFDTDAASVWGKYFSYPYYPSKYNSLEPATNQTNKTPIVNIQWAQRDPVAGYGKEIKDSRQSFQANDYISNEFNFSYFENLLSEYLKNQKTDFMQITIGLEAGQEAVRFKDEFERQLDELQSLANQKVIQNTTMDDFALWYQNKYPGVSPSHFLTKDESFWYMSTKFRVAIFKEDKDFILKDLRYYTNIPFSDYLYADENEYLDRKVPAAVDNLMFANQINLGKTGKLDIIEKFDRLILKLDNREVQVDTKGVISGGSYLVEAPIQDKEVIKRDLKYLTIYHKVIDPITDALALFKYSKINGQTVLGIAIFDSKLIGFRGGLPGIFKYDFQTLSKFLTPTRILDKWQPWIN
ncbi:hypothetical protein A2693_04555 [Candidatus Curtissbacteria bacterium RIFCSPHIGHO2_01_FULL_40_12]|uniref:Glycosyltransferase RgtA/B/C/D-like domain-containing protein n=1 Tax=Candidatus Curtissbacteria bacterium RIFCSPHIGHO2_01_FULL_40_12 TaxID=1797710 RepID=A0A1F5GA31_9BACT|nr:MAG: hypothetical protein A2693_04555 [Candidatus Curtissbacteria bacterium RIFCSPHIGHO2_01_FULL_40_12]